MVLFLQITFPESENVLVCKADGAFQVGFHRSELPVNGSSTLIKISVSAPKNDLTVAPEVEMRMFTGRIL